MAARWSIVGGVAIAAGIAWFAFHRGGEPAGTTRPEGTTEPAGATPGSAGATPRSGKVDLSPRTRPEQLGTPSEARLPATGTAFEAQVRDGEWAPKTETEIKRRFQTGIRGGKLDATECRQDQCLLTMSGTEAEMTKALADLETEGGLRDFADHIVLGGPEQRDGKMVIKAYAVFDRRPPVPDTN